MKNFKQWLMCLVCMLAVYMPITVYAAGEVDIHKSSTIEVVAQHEETLLKGMGFDLYHLAATYPDASRVSTDDFSFFQWHFDLNDTYELQKMAVTFEAFAVQEGITAFDSGKTDNNGILVFPDNQAELKPGVYLVTGHSHIQDGYVYNCEPFVVNVPSLDDEGNWDYDVISYPKFSKVPVTDIYTDLTVVKVWKDQGHENVRPEEVTINLYKNGELYQTVTLSADNDWRYTWTLLDKTADWVVTENATAEYTTVIEKDGITYVVTNTYKTDDTPPPPELPDTGMHWGPALVLFTAGVALVLIGVVRRKTGEYEK